MKGKITIICLILIMVVVYNKNPIASREIKNINNITTAICKPDTPLNIFINELDKDITYKAKYSIDEGYATEEMKLKLSLIRNLGNGSIFQLKLNQDKKVSEEERFPIYLFVQHNRIYRLWKSADEIGRAKTVEDLLRDSTIIYQDENLSDDLTEGQEGIHHYISVEGGKIESHFYQLNDYANVVGYFETFVWEDGRGLAEYRSGFSAEADLLELKKTQ